MRIPEIVPLTHDLFSSLVELEAQATNRKEKYQKALTELNEHVSGVEMRINQERMTIKGRLSELDQEEQVLQKKIREVTKKSLMLLYIMLLLMERQSFNGKKHDYRKSHRNERHLMSSWRILKYLRKRIRDLMSSTT